MAKIKYRTCDICGDKLESYDLFSLFKPVTYGYRILNKCLSGLDICNKCMEKIRYLSIDKKDEEKFISEFFKNEKKYDNSDMQSAYYEGLEDALSVLSHKRLKDVKIQKR